MIYIVADFEPTTIVGGIRVLYRHAEWLVEAGIPAAVLAPAGRPVWFDSPAPVVGAGSVTIAPDDLLVMPEAVGRHPLTDLLLSLPNRIVVCCQNHLYAFHGCGVIGALAGRLAGAYTNAAASARALERTFGLVRVPVVPCSVDPRRFQPAAKQLAVAVMPRKQPVAAAYIRGAVAARAPDLAAIPWLDIDGRTETDTAALLGQAAVFLSLSRDDSFGLPPVEAMAAGCVIVGFHGGGGRDYATAANGVWFGGDDIDACADGLIDVLRALRDGRRRGWIASLTAGGRATAAHYSPARAKAALLQLFGPDGRFGDGRA